VSPKICLLSSCGGHLTELRLLGEAYAGYEHFFVVNDRIPLPADMAARTHFIAHAERDWRVALNLWEAWRILRGEKPDLVLTTGAGPAVPFAVCARVLRIPVIYVETGAQVRTPSLTARLMYPLADRFFVQWPTLLTRFPRARLGSLLR
jgi:beta-1,4-N-acetylglucosaminyltransferase